MKYQFNVEVDIPGMDEDSTGGEALEALRYMSWLLMGKPEGFDGKPFKVLSLVDPKFPIETMIEFSEKDSDLKGD